MGEGGNPRAPLPIMQPLSVFLFLVINFFARCFDAVFFPAILIVTLSLCLKSVAAMEGAYK